MSRRKELDRHRHALGEIREILNSMKTLAYMETRKLSRRCDAQRRVVQSIEGAAADFLVFHPELLPGPAAPPAICLLIGTERGFCGDLNRSLLNRVHAGAAAEDGAADLLVTVGRKLDLLAGTDDRVVARLAGASVIEEIPTVLSALVDAVVTLQSAHGASRVRLLYNGARGAPATEDIVPPFQRLARSQPRTGSAPQLNLPPRTFFLQLCEHYLFAALHSALYDAFMAENQGRIRHLEGAVRHLEEESSRLARQSSSLRQEEIIEEIEVILLSADSVVEP